MTHSLAEMLKNNSRLIGIVFILPLMLASLILSVMALFTLTNTFDENDAPKHTESTADRVIYGEPGLSIEKVKAETWANSELSVIMQDAHTLLLVIGYLDSCSIDFTAIAISDETIILDTSDELEDKVSCTEVSAPYSFVLKSITPLSVSNVRLTYAYGASDKNIAITKPVFEGTTLGDEELIWNNYTLRELSSMDEILDAEVLSLLESPDVRSAIRSEDSKRVVFSFGGSSSCPVNFVSMNVYADELQLISRAGDASSICTPNYEARFFEIIADKPITATKIVVQSSEYLDQTIELPIAELIFD